MKLLSPKKYSQEFKVGYHAVLNWCKNGKLPTLKTDGGSFKIILENIKTDEEKESELETKKILFEIESNNKIISELIEKNTILLSKINKKR